MEAAAELARNALDWRLQYQPDKIQPSDIPIALPQGCWRWAGWARDGSFGFARLIYPLVLAVTSDKGPLSVHTCVRACVQTSWA